MIMLLSILVAILLRSRYIRSDDHVLLKITYYFACMVWTPIFGIPFYKLITMTITNGPYSKIYDHDGYRS